MSGDVCDFLLPDLGEGLVEAEVLTWLVSVGDAVSVDQPVAEVETAKATVEVPCPYTGTVAALHAAPGETVAVGERLISIGTAAPGGADGSFGAVPDSPQASGEALSSRAVLVGYGIGRSTRRRGGGRRRIRGESGAGTTASAAPPSSPGRPIRTAVVSPLVRRMAREHGIDVGALRGSGTGGLVLRRDVQAAIAESTAAPASGPASTTSAYGERVPLQGPRRVMAERMARSRREIPEATVWVDADATGLLDLRAALNEADPQRPVSLLALLGKFCLLGLRRFPALNAQVDTERGELVRFSHVNLGFAAQTPRGLMVPVVHGAQAMTVRELAAELTAATAQARAGSLPPARLTGGTFTVNNYGVFGVDGSAAVINHPEAAILGMGRIIRRPWVVGDDLAARPVTELTLAFDHRVCDGEEAGGFLRFVADCVERPSLLLGDV
ncbi:MAG: dihydrolipoamide acetyltransferase family protein [Nocardiopsaceae bacterium]|nr:dihydrolipoamide acetyltransferase family protein [Nocardiopsaceae bacterium]